MNVTSMDLESKIKYCIMVFIIVYIICYVSTSNLKLKKGFLNNIIVLFISFFYTFILIVSDTFFLKFKSPVIIIVRAFFQICTFCFLIKIFYKDRLSKILAILTIYSTTNLISSLTTYAFLLILNNNIICFNINFDDNNTFTFVCIMLVMIVLSKLINSFFKKVPDDIPAKYWRYLFVVEFSLVCVSVTFFDETQINPTIDAFFIFLFLLCAGVVTTLMFLTITKFYVDEKYHLLMQVQNKALMNELNAENIRNESLKSFKHDINSLLTSIYLLSQNNDTTKIIEVVAEKIELLKQNEQKVLTSNIFIDSILNLKLNQINDLGICLTTELAYLNIELPFSPSDLSSVLMNLIENSIDASKIVLENNETPFIFLKLCIYKNNFSIVIKNKYIGNIKKNNDYVLTSKYDSFLHGYGLKNVENIIKKYNGLFVYDYKDQIFVVKAMLPLD